MVLSIVYLLLPNLSEIHIAPKKGPHLPDLSWLAQPGKGGISCHSKEKGSDLDKKKENVRSRWDKKNLDNSSIISSREGRLVDGDCLIVLLPCKTNLLRRVASLLLS